MKGMLRKAGDKLRSVDDAYAEKVANMYLPDGLPRDIGGPQAAARGIGAAFLGGVPVSSFGDNAATNAAVITGALSRYAAPAAGITLAGKGIYDMAVALGSGEQTPGTVMP